MKNDLNSITKLVLIVMGTNTSKIYAKEEEVKLVETEEEVRKEGDYLLDHKFISKSNPRRAGFITHFCVL